MIFRKDTLKLEHFEPHGNSFRDTSNAINIVLYDFLDKMNAYLKLKNNIELIEANVVCPYKHGFQALECFSYLPKKTEGFCLMWSFFFAELVLKNPNLTSKEITELILDDIYKNNKSNVVKEEWLDYFSNLITGYTLLLDEKLIKYFSKYYGEDISIETIITIIKNQNKEEDVLKLAKIIAQFKEYIKNEMLNKPHDKDNDFFKDISTITKPNTSSKIKNIICPKGTKKNKITGICEDNEQRIKDKMNVKKQKEIEKQKKKEEKLKNKEQEKIEFEERKIERKQKLKMYVEEQKIKKELEKQQKKELKKQEKEQKTKNNKNICPKGTKKNKITGICEPNIEKEKKIKKENEDKTKNNTHIIFEDD